jgi:hypothetical protein
MRLAPMRAAIDERLTRLREQLASRAIGPQLAELRNSFERIASAEVDRAMAEELQALEPQQQEQVRRVIEALAHKLAHVPLAGIRAAAPHANAETLEAFFKEARLQREQRAAASPRDVKSLTPPPLRALAAGSGTAAVSKGAAVPTAAGLKTAAASQIAAGSQAAAASQTAAGSKSAAPKAHPSSPLQAPAMAHTSASSQKRSR